VALPLLITNSSEEGTAGSAAISGLRFPLRDRLAPGRTAPGPTAAPPRPRGAGGGGAVLRARGAVQGLPGRPKSPGPPRAPPPGQRGVSEQNIHIYIYAYIPGGQCWVSPASRGCTAPCNPRVSVNLLAAPFVFAGFEATRAPLAGADELPRGASRVLGREGGVEGPRFLKRRC